MKRTFVVTIGFIFFLIFLKCAEGSPTMVNEKEELLGEWLIKAPMPTKRQELAAELISNKIYVVGGMDRFGVPLITVEIYDPITDRWSAVAPLPIEKHHLSLSAVGGKPYAIAGSSTTFPEFNDTKDVFEYDPSTMNWKTLTSMPTPQHGTFGVSYIDGIYLIGGGVIEGIAPSDVTEVFFP